MDVFTVFDNYGIGGVGVLAILIILYKINNGEIIFNKYDINRFSTKDKPLKNMILFITLVVLITLGGYAFSVPNVFKGIGMFIFMGILTFIHLIVFSFYGLSLKVMKMANRNWNSMNIANDFIEKYFEFILSISSTLHMMLIGYVIWYLNTYKSVFDERYLETHETSIADSQYLFAIFIIVVILSFYSTGFLFSFAKSNVSKLKTYIVEDGKKWYIEFYDNNKERVTILDEQGGFKMVETSYFYGKKQNHE